MKKKISKGAILEIPLINFNIRPINLWVNRPGRRYSEDLIKRTRELTGEALLEATRQVDDDHRERMQKQPMTVGQLIKRYKYRFPGSKHAPHGRLVSLGDEPASELKEKLIELGLTPDDWQALAPHDELLAHLSKPVIIDVPVKEIFTDRSNTSNECHQYLQCTKEEVVAKTIRDLIQINPVVVLTENDSYDSRRRFFTEHKRLFVALRQQLIKKGFGVKDGQFFAWNPEDVSLVKAREVLKKHKLSPSEVRKFAKIVVAERWVI